MPGLSLFDELGPLVFQTDWTPAFSTGVVNATTAQTSVWRLDNFVATSTDTIDHLVQVWYAGGLICTINVPANAGNGTVPTVDMMAAVKAATGMDHLIFPASKVLQLATPVVVSTGKHVTFLMVGGTLQST